MAVRQVTGVVLSHTVMKGPKFCTNIAVQQDDGSYRQIRPQMPGGWPIWYDRLPYTVNQLKDRWQPGRQVRLASVAMPPRADRRPTHPEDRLCRKLRDTKMMGEVPPDQLRGIINSLTRSSLSGLFPGIQVNAYGTAFVGAEQRDRSVGYIRCAVTFKRGEKNKLRATLERSSRLPGLFGRTRYRLIADAPVNGLLLRREIEQGKYTLGVRYNGIARLALGTPWSSPERFVGQRCYVMLSHFHPT